MLASAWPRDRGNECCEDDDEHGGVAGSHVPALRLKISNSLATRSSSRSGLYCLRRVRYLCSFTNASSSFRMYSPYTQNVPVLLLKKESEGREGALAVEPGRSSLDRFHPSWKRRHAWRPALSCPGQQGSPVRPTRAAQDQQGFREQSNNVVPAWCDVANLFVQIACSRSRRVLRGHLAEHLLL
jgi:hypothetical protein